MQDLELQFDLENINGSALVTCERIERPERWGFQYLGRDSVRLDSIIHFPVCSAKVIYEPEGYARCMGWVQVLSIFENSTETIIVDVPPQFSQVNSPYFCWGYNPSFFDAPYALDEEYKPTPNLRWSAYAFLVSSLDKLMSKNINPICGFKWGYKINVDRKVYISELKAVGSCEWSNITQPVLEKEYQDWKFNSFDSREVSTTPSKKLGNRNQDKAIIKNRL